MLCWNETEVRTSFLSQKMFRAASCGFLAFVSPQTQPQALKAFAEQQDRFSGLHVSGIADLSFLSDFPNLRYVEIVQQNKVDPRPLDGLTNLRGLRLETPGAGIDFSCFPELEVFDGDWHEDNSRINSCQELRDLRIRHFKPGSGDLSSLADVTRLEWLSIVQTGVTSLAGLETLRDLRYFTVAYAPKLESLELPSERPIELREMKVEKARKIASYAPLAEFGRLRRLHLTSCAPMADLQWIQGLAELDFLSIVETNVVDGDLSPLLRLPKLRYVGTMDKKHYNCKFEALNRLLNPQQESAQQ